jgi:hypothetical protein
MHSLLIQYCKYSTKNTENLVPYPEYNEFIVAFKAGSIEETADVPIFV